jgi:hypothetical protein
LNELAFRVDRMLGGLKECGVPESIENAASESRSDSASLKEVSASLAALGS